MKLCEVVASEISTGVKFKKIGWQLATLNFEAKTSPKWALLTEKFWGGFGFSLNDKSIDAMHKFTKNFHTRSTFIARLLLFEIWTFCKTSAKRSLYAFLLHYTQG